MLSQGSIENESVGIALPLSGSPDSTGSLTFGGGLFTHSFSYIYED